ncbi:MAG: prolipoprotein diacylglyceryl transferase [Defluviitaleaceae bacterium]|nr:prolipoprotein diacylglyceryl transferase [Defluviitaleaceae bacterium]
MPIEASFPNLGIDFPALPRIAFELFGFSVYLYGLLIMLGVVAGLVYAWYEAKRTGQNPELYFDFVLYAMPLGFLGTRLYYVAFSWESYKNNLLAIFNFREGGLAVYGGIIACVLTAVVYTRVKRVPFGLLADTAAPALLLGQVIGRWGNFFNREAFGSYTDSLLALRYLESTVAYIPGVVREKAFTIDGFSYIQVHPTFLYESCWNLALFILLNIYKGRKKFDGEIFLLYLLGYGLGRVWIESLRTDQLLLAGTGIAVSQLLSAGLIVFAGTGIFVKRRQQKFMR